MIKETDFSRIVDAISCAASGLHTDVPAFRYHADDFGGVPSLSSSSPSCCSTWRRSRRRWRTRVSPVAIDGLAPGGRDGRRGGMIGEIMMRKEP